MDWIGIPLGAVMRLCYQVTQNYGLAIILFTVLTKVILFPVSLWVHANGIRMVRIQPAINRLKVKYFGDMDRIADEQERLFKQEKYNPFLGVVPVLVQLFLLIGLIQVIYHPLSYVLSIPASITSSVIDAAHNIGGVDSASGAAELLALSWAQKSASIADIQAIPGITGGMLDSMLNMRMQFAGLDLAGVPMTDGGILLLVPFAAALASVALSLSQNVMNPLQAQQSKLSQMGTMAFSVGLSLVVGFMVPAGVGFYWIWSNLFTIVQQFILNRVYPPAKHIDYEQLEQSKIELAQYQNIGKQSAKRSKQDIKREKADYKRFFSIDNKHLVFYSESNGFYKYFEGVINFLLENTNLTIHYITSDPNDQVFDLSQKEPKLKPYYIGEKKLITLFLRLEADVVVMTMSDLDNYHYKRSYIQKNIEYVYMFHYPLSTHMVLHTGALDHYDTILCVGEFQFDEIRKAEQVYNLPRKNLIACGYGQLEKLYAQYTASNRKGNERPKVLIAPSWQEANILDSCLDDLLSELLGQSFDVVVRPHPEYVKRYKARMDQIVNKYPRDKYPDLSFELDFTSNTSIFASDMVITDWSGTAYEFSFVTSRPCVFIDTPPKINNPEYTKLGIEPLELSLREQIGIRVDPAQMSGLASRVRELLSDTSRKESIEAIRNKYISNFGSSSRIAGRYLVEAIQRHIQDKKQT